MEVLLSPEVEEKVNRLAAQNESGAAEYVSQLVERYVDHDEWFRSQVQHAIDQFDSGEFLTHEQVGEMILDHFRK